MKQSPIEQRVQKGSTATAKAIGKGDAKTLKKCLDTFRAMEAMPATLAKSIENAPIDLLDKAGYGIRIFSKALDREITLGADISWTEIKELLKIRLSPSELSLLLEAKKAVQGTIHCCLTT